MTTNIFPVFAHRPLDVLLDNPSLFMGLSQATIKN